MNGILEFINQHIFIIVVICAVAYISYDLWKTKKQGTNLKTANKSFSNFKKAVKEATWKDYVFAFLMFMIIFFLARGFVIAQNEAQECSVWINPGIGIYGYGGGNVAEILQNYTNAGFNDLPQNRSYNFYQRWFNANGGRANFVNIQCNFKLDVQRFLKNVRLDYNERNKYK